MEDLIDQIKKHKAKKVLLQLPEGLKTSALEIVAALEKESIECIFSGEACYGACDIKDSEASMLGCDILVHVGHNKFYVDFKTAVPVLYYPYFLEKSIKDFDASMIKEKKLGVVASVQHLNIMEDAKKILEKKGKTVFLGGQILGCWTVNAEKISSSVDAFLFIGSGKFHALALREKKVYVLDLEKMSIELLDTAQQEKIRWARISNAREAKTFAVLVSSKKGQFQLLGRAEEIKKRIEKSGRSAFVVIMDEINDQKLLGIKADAFVNTACPRIADDHFSKPFVNASDLNKILEKVVD